MSAQAPIDRQSSTSSGHAINARIDSAFREDPAHRGSLASSELDSIHQTKSFIQAKQLEAEDKRELAAKIKQLERSKQSTK